MKRNKILIIIIIVLIILGGLVIGGWYGYNNYLEKVNNDVKEKFYSYLFQNNFDKTMDSSTLQKIMGKLNEKKYVSTTNIDFTNTLKNDYNLDIDKLRLELSTNNKDDNKSTVLNFIYSNNEIFNVDILSNNKYIGIKNSDVIKNYIAVDRKNSKTILEKIDKEFGSLYNSSNKFIEDYKISGNDKEIFSIDNSDYIKLFRKYVKSNEYLDEGVALLEQNGEKVETQIYSLTMSKQEFVRLFSVITNQIIEDENIIDSIIAKNKTNSLNNVEEIISELDFKDIVVEEEQNDIHAFRESDATSGNQNENPIDFATDNIEENEVITKFSNSAKKIQDLISNYDNYRKNIDIIKYTYCLGTGIGIDEKKENVQNNLIEFFENVNEIIENKISNDENVKFVVYESNNKTIKTSILLGNSLQIDLQYITISDKNEETQITIVEKEEENYNGYTIRIIKNKTNIIDNTQIEVDKIKDTKIVNKIEIKLNIEGSETSNKFDNTLKFIYSGNDGKFITTLNNKLNFKNTDVEELNSENAILIDNLEENEFNYLINKFNYRLENVYNDKLTKMNLINKNTSDTILQNTQEDIVQDDTQEKNNIIDVLVDHISNEMGIAENENREYTLKDLKNLQIDGYDITVSVSQEIAIVKINGYTFKIDKEFNLSE